MRASLLAATYNDLDAVRAIFAANPGEIAGVILEPVVGNSGFIPPTMEFLTGLQAIAKEVRRAPGAGRPGRRQRACVYWVPASSSSRLGRLVKVKSSSATC